jgi:hypothetical protein
MPSDTARRPLLLASILGTAMAAVGCATRRSAASVEIFIANSSLEWTASYVSGRTQVLEQILAEDFVGTSPSGRTHNKRETIESAKEAPSVLASATMDRVVVKVFDGVAIAFGEDLLTFKSGTPAPLRNKWTDTWLLRDDRWLVVASHESTVKP